MTLDESLNRLDLPEAITSGWIGRYREPWRHYHTLEHIAHMLASLRPADATAELIGAIWLHDVVYDPRASDNEERSAEQALGDLTGSAIDRVLVAELIRGTKHHRVRGPAHDVLNDLDLLILGAEPAAYARYAAQIRQEYAHVPDRIYAEHRARLLRAFDDSPIFRTAAYQPLEVAAHRNLTWEIEQLESPRSAL